MYRQDISSMVTVSRKNLYITGITAVIIIATVLSLIATRNGLAFDRDGCYYLGMAGVLSTRLGAGPIKDLDDNLLERFAEYYAETARRWPPFYPILLSAAGLSSSPYQAGRRLHLTFPLIVGLLLWFIVYQNHQSHARAFPVTAILLLSPEILRLNGFVYSEIPFLIWQLSAMSAFSRYLHTKRITFLAVTAVFISLACLTRYIGVVMAVALVLTLWRFNHEQRLWPRIRNSILCLPVMILPVLLYLIYPLIDGQAFDIAGRNLSWDVNANKISVFFALSIVHFTNYLSPVSFSLIIRVLFVLFFISAIILLFVHQRRNNSEAILSGPVFHFRYFIKLCIILYLSAVCAGSFSLDHVLGNTGITSRIFAPVVVWAVLLTALSVSDFSPVDRSGSYRFIPGWLFLYVFIMISANLAGATLAAFEQRDTVAEKHQPWQSAAVLAYVQLYDESPWIISNKACQILHYAGIPAFQLPSHFNVFQARPNEKYFEKMFQLREMLHHHNGIVLFFNPFLHYQTIKEVSEETTLDECMELLDVKIDFYTDDCIVLRP